MDGRDAPRPAPPSAGSARRQAMRRRGGFPPRFPATSAPWRRLRRCRRRQARIVRPPCERREIPKAGLLPSRDRPWKALCQYGVVRPRQTAKACASSRRIGEKFRPPGCFAAKISRSPRPRIEVAALGPVLPETYTARRKAGSAARLSRLGGGCLRKRRSKMRCKGDALRPASGRASPDAATCDPARSGGGSMRRRQTAGRMRRPFDRSGVGST